MTAILVSLIFLDFSCALQQCLLAYFLRTSEARRRVTDLIVRKVAGLIAVTCIQILSQTQVTAMRQVTILTMRSVTLLHVPEVLKKYVSRHCWSAQEKSRKIGLTSMAVMRLMLAKSWSYEDSEIVCTSTVATQFLTVTTTSAITGLLDFVETRRNLWL